MAREREIVATLRNVPGEKLDLLWDDEEKVYALNRLSSMTSSFISLTRAEFIALLKEGLTHLNIDQNIVNSVFVPLSRKNIVR